MVPQMLSDEWPSGRYVSPQTARGTPEFNSDGVPVHPPQRVFNTPDGRTLDKVSQQDGGNHDITHELSLTQPQRLPEETPGLANPDAPCLLYTSPSPRDLSTSRMPSSA